jgi:hypothetical protein
MRFIPLNMLNKMRISLFYKYTDYHQNLRITGVSDHFSPLKKDFFVRDLNVTFASLFLNGVLARC